MSTRLATITSLNVLVECDYCSTFHAFEIVNADDYMCICPNTRKQIVLRSITTRVPLVINTPELG